MFFVGANKIASQFYKLKILSFRAWGLAVPSPKRPQTAVGQLLYHLHQPLK